MVGGARPAQLTARGSPGDRCRDGRAAGWCSPRGHRGHTQGVFGPRCAGNESSASGRVAPGAAVPRGCAVGTAPGEVAGLCRGPGVMQAPLVGFPKWGASRGGQREIPL